MMGIYHQQLQMPGCGRPASLGSTSTVEQRDSLLAATVATHTGDDQDQPDSTSNQGSSHVQKQEKRILEDGS